MLGAHQRPVRDFRGGIAGDESSVARRAQQPDSFLAPAIDRSESPGGQAQTTQAQCCRITAPFWSDVSHALEGRRPVQTGGVSQSKQGNRIHRRLR